MAPYKRGKIWYACVYDAERGEHIRRSSKSSKKADAERIEEEIRKEIEGRRKQSGFVAYPVAIVAYGREHVPKLREPTQRLYMRYMRTMSEYFDAMFVQEITAKESAAFRNWMTLTRKPKVKERESVLTMRCLSSFLSFCAERQIIDANPLLGKAMRLPQSKKRGRTFSREEQAKLLSEARSDMRIFVLLCLQCGMRHSEALRVRAQDVDFGRNEILIPVTKNGKPRAAPMTEAVRAQIRTQNFHPETGWLFAREDGARQLSKKTAWNTLARRCGIEDGHIHDLRRTYGYDLREKGAPMHTISALMGHSSTAVTESVYAGPRPAELHAAVRLLDAPDAQIVHIDQLVKRRDSMKP